MNESRMLYFEELEGVAVELRTCAAVGEVGKTFTRIIMTGLVVDYHKGMIGRVDTHVQDFLAWRFEGRMSSRAVGDHLQVLHEAAHDVWMWGSRPYPPWPSLSPRVVRAARDALRLWGSTDVRRRTSLAWGIETCRGLLDGKYPSAVLPGMQVRKLCAEMIPRASGMMRTAFMDMYYEACLADGQKPLLPDAVVRVLQGKTDDEPI